MASLLRALDYVHQEVIRPLDKFRAQNLEKRAVLMMALLFRPGLHVAQQHLDEMHDV